MTDPAEKQSRFGESTKKNEADFHTLEESVLFCLMNLVREVKAVYIFSITRQIGSEISLGQEGSVQKSSRL
jgi:hypothetical protein